VQQVELAQLKPQPKGLMQKSDSINQFMSQVSQRNNLVQNAIDKSRLEIQQEKCLPSKDVNP